MFITMYHSFYLSRDVLFLLISIYGGRLEQALKSFIRLKQYQLAISSSSNLIFELPAHKLLAQGPRHLFVFIPDGMRSHLSHDRTAIQKGTRVSYEVSYVRFRFFPLSFQSANLGADDLPARPGSSAPHSIAALPVTKGIGSMALTGRESPRRFSESATRAL